MTSKDFVEESNRIEGILCPPTQSEIDEFERFIELDEVTIDELVRFVSVYQPDARLRDKFGLDVRVGNHIPMRGSPEIRKYLQELLDNNMAPFEKHITFERLHPFTDGNGRSGRMLWAWQVGEDVALSLGFLHRWYYQTLSQ